MLIALPRNKKVRKDIHWKINNENTTKLLWNVSEWEYMSEGGANVIFKYKGKEKHPIFQQCVLRLRKKNVMSSSTPEQTLLYTTHQVMFRLHQLGSHQYIQAAQLVYLPSLFLAVLNDSLMNHSSRPKTYTEGLDIMLCEGILLPNISIFYSTPSQLFICFEIKPKCGFLPVVLQDSVKERICRYCLHQQYKYQKQEIICKSDYCPLDLFSNDPTRIHKALSALLQNPQNNFRFLSPNQYPRSSQHVFTPSLFPSTEAFINVITKLFITIPILDDLKIMHQLDVINIEGMWNLHQLIKSFTCDSFIQPHHTMEEIHSSPHSLNSFQIQHILSFIPSTCSIKSWGELTVQQVQDIYERMLEEFLMATSIKDCSILVTLRRKEEDEEKRKDNDIMISSLQHDIVFDNGESYQCIVSLVDIDPKSHTKLKKYYTLDQEILHCSCEHEKVGHQTSCSSNKLFN